MMSESKLLRGFFVAGIVLALAAAGGVAMAKQAAVAEEEEAEKDLYPLTTCPISGKALGAMGDALVKDYDGREVRFCCGGCPAKFEEDLPASLAKLDETIIEIQKDTYPLKTCVISNEALGGDMGDPIDRVFDNQLVRFCCKGCIKKFEADPVQYLSLIQDVGEGKREAPKAEGSDHK